jgi:hypothetical protein
MRPSRNMRNPKANSSPAAPNTYRNNSTISPSLHFCLFNQGLVVGFNGLLGACGYLGVAKDGAQRRLILQLYLVNSSPIDNYGPLFATNPAASNQFAQCRSTSALASSKLLPLP